MNNLPAYPDIVNNLAITDIPNFMQYLSSKI